MTYRSGKYHERPYKIAGECECRCALSQHRQVVVTAPDGVQEVVPMACGGCNTCQRFEIRTCCGTGSCCNWGGRGPAPRGRHDSELLSAYDRACARQDRSQFYGGGGFEGQDAAAKLRDEMLRRGMRDPWTPGSSRSSSGRDR
jgi:hypothetical protein